MASNHAADRAAAIPPHDFSDLLVSPHLDLHLVLSDDPAFKLRIDLNYRVRPVPSQTEYVLTQVIGNLDFEWRYQFFAPHNDPPVLTQPVQPGRRFENLPKIDTAGNITGGAPGVYLFEIAVNSARDKGFLGSVVGRLQVHKQLIDWWFGNDSLTTARDNSIAHSQISMYARFSDDNSGADLIGDITGHNYFPLTSSDESKVVVQPRGRVLGVAETGDTPVVVSGPGGTKPNNLPVYVVEYATDRQDLNPLNFRDLAHADQRANVAFLPEGFLKEDKLLFQSIVTQTSLELFEKPRHQPYPLLSDSMNSFWAFAPSRQRTITCGFRVTDNDRVFGTKGVPIPAPPTVRFTGQLDSDYSLETLIELVGLPKRGESREPEDLRRLWSRQQLPGFSLDNVRNDDLIKAWKSHTSDGILQASDSLFGLHMGGRWADGSTVSTSLTQESFPDPDPTDPTKPPPDMPSASLTSFIGRLYDFYKMRPVREITLDPRRHPPELYATKDLANPGNFVLSYLSGLQYVHPPNYPIGKNWIPNDTRVTPSRGLVAIAAYDGFLGGTCFNRETLIGLTIASSDHISFTSDSNRPGRMTRNPPTPPAVDPNDFTMNLNHFISKTAHELGHSFNLGDEYETAGLNIDPHEATEDPHDMEADNLTRISFLGPTPNPNRTLNTDKVKWLQLPRTRVSSRVVADVLQDSSPPHNLAVTVPLAEIGQWMGAFDAKETVSLLSFATTAFKQQLPLKLAAADLRYAPNLAILTRPDGTTGTVVLGNPTGSLYPNFGPGTLMYVPEVDRAGKPALAADPAVIAFLHTSQKPLNPGRNLQVPSSANEDPVAVPGFQPTPENAYLTVGLYEGGNQWSRGFYRPTGACKMRNQETGNDTQRQFCYVCKWLIVNLVNPSILAAMDHKHFPR